jgi:hypothetical protein
LVHVDFLPPHPFLPLLPKASRQQKIKKELSLRVLKPGNSRKIAAQDYVQVSADDC